MSRVKKIVCWMIGVLFVLSCNGVTLAKESAKTKGASSEAKGAVSPSGGSASMNAKLGAEKRVRETLNGTQWALELAPMSGEQGKRPIEDTIRFREGTITSEKLSSEGFPTTNFSVTIGSDGVTVWETMQTAKDNSVVFWRGELHGETIRGILSRHSANGKKVEDWVFSGQIVRTPPPAPPPPPAPAPASKAPPPAGAGKATTGKTTGKK